MSGFKKVVFVCTDNTCLSNIAAAVFGNILGDRDIAVASRGLEVLFPEPINQKAVAILKSHGVSLLDNEAKPLESTDLGDDTLVLTMSTMNKIAVLDGYPDARNVYTLAEFVGEPGEVSLPFGGTLADYGRCYEHIDMLTKLAAEQIFKEGKQDDSTWM